MFAAGRQYNHLPGYFPGSDVALNKFRISAYIALGEAADALGLGPYAVLGHSYGAFVALQNAVDLPGAAAQTIVSSGLASAKYLASVWDNLAKFQPVELREQVTKIVGAREVSADARRGGQPPA